MSIHLHLKEIERKAFRSIYQDGLWDIYFGLIVLSMSIFVYRPLTGYGPFNIVAMAISMTVSYACFWAGKKFITIPRMGQVQFGVQRKKRKVTMAIVLSLVVLIQIILVALQLLVWAHPDISAKYNNLLPERNIMDLVIASIGALMVGPSMILVAYFRDFPRGYFIAIMISLAVFLMIYLNQPVYPIVIGALIALPGLVLFVGFLQKYPLRRGKASNE
jgi:hypothetical protein